MSLNRRKLGIKIFYVVCFVVSTSRVGWSGPTTSVIVLWAVLLGSLAQLMASYFDFKKNNPFGSIVFGAYGLFWSAMAGVWLIQMGSFGLATDLFLGSKTGFFALAAWSELFITLLGFYGSGAVLVNKVFGKAVFPLGKSIL